MSLSIGNRIYKTIHRPPRELVEKFRHLPSSNIGDMMNRLFNMQADIKPYTKDVSLLGTAFTVKAPEGDNLFFHMAICLAEPGDVLVVDAGGGMERSLCGEMMFNEAVGRGLAGIVVNGCIRDVDSLHTLHLPVYAKGVTPQGPWKNGPGEINTPVCCGGQVICPGDILVGDADGIVVVHPGDAAELAEAARKKFDGEQRRLEENHRGVYPDVSSKWASQIEKCGAVLFD
ncbi:MAG: RraA family protein [Sphaerochaetaceae bacterium]|nr:RraA family protein [Spirochaetales bacterium]MDY5499418.1 RraA family protein [Sphaerochaetaceae bacterium]